MPRTAVLEELRDRATEPEGDGYRAWPGEGWGIELETGDALWGLVRAIRPALVLESGSGKAISTRFLAAACQVNDHGRVVTFEPDADLARTARTRLRGLPAEVRQGDTLAWRGEQPGFVFLDSYPADRRHAEIEHWLAQPVFVAIHDACRYTLPAGLLLPVARGLWIGRGGA